MKRENIAKVIFALLLLCSMGWSATYTLTVESVTGGSVTPSSKSVTGGTSVEITATEDYGYRFDQWSSSSTSCKIADASSATTKVTVNANCTITPSYIVRYAYSVSGVANGSTEPSAYSMADAGEKVSIKAIPNTGYRFVEWSSSSTACTFASKTSASTTVTISGSCGITAKFIRQYKLTMAMGEGGSLISPSGSVMVDSSVSKYIYTYAKSGFTFKNWSISGSGCTVNSSTSYSTYAYLKGGDCKITALYQTAYPVTVKHLGYDGTSDLTNTYTFANTGPSTTLYPVTGYPYKPSTWKVTSGNCRLSSLATVSNTVTMGSKACTVEVQYAHSEIKKVLVGKNNITSSDYYQKDPHLMAYSLETMPGTWYRVDISYASGVKYYGHDESLRDSIYVYSSNPLYIRGDGKTHYFTNARVESHTVTVSEIASVPLDLEVDEGGVVDSPKYPDLPVNANVLISATTLPYYKFVGWKIVSGTCRVGNTTSLSTFLSTATSRCSLHAVFEKDESYKPNVEIVEIDESSYPTKLCVDYVIKNDTLGYYADYSIYDYSLLVNGSPVQYVVEEGKEEIHTAPEVSLVIVIDGSGSINSTNAAAIRDVLDQYVDNLGNNESLALVEFGGNGDNATVLHHLSKDKVSLKKAVARYVTTGNTNTMAGVKLALDELENASGDKIVYLIAEGATNSNASYTYSSLTSRAKSMGVKIYTNYLKLTSSTAKLTDVEYLSKNTGGGILDTVTSIAEIVSPLSGLFEKSYVKPTYKLCFEPEDVIPNGNSYLLEVQASLLGMSDSTGKIWREPVCVGADVLDSIFLSDAGKANADPTHEMISRATESLSISVSSQDFSGDCTPITEVPVKVSCKVSGDVETVLLDHVHDGYYMQQKPLAKREDVASAANGILECAAEDEILVEYVDPVYKTTTVRSAMFLDTIKTVGDFAAVGEAKSLEYVQTNKGAKFDFKMYSYSASVNDVDTMDVLFYTSQGDSLWVNVVETGNYTSNFIYTGEFAVVYDAADKKDDRLDVMMNGNSFSNKAVVYARLVENGKVGEMLDSMLVFFDFPAQDIALYNAEDESAEIDRATESLRLYVNALDESNGGVDTIEARLYCKNSGDSEVLKLVETGDTTDSRKVYVSADFPKSERKVAKNDGMLSCASIDTVVAEYNSPYYVEPISVEYAFADSAAIVPVDSAEIYDKDLDGKADFVRFHLAKYVDTDVLSIDTVFWNAKGRKGRGVAAGQMKASGDGWVEAYLDDAFEYGVTSLAAAEKNFLSVSKKNFNYSQKVKLADRVGAVPVFAEKRPGVLSNDDYLGGQVELPPDTLVVTLSEPLEGSGWKKLFQFAETCGSGKVRDLALQEKPQVDESGRVWSVVIPRGIDVRTGHCLVTNHAASLQDSDGNAPGVGSIAIEGDDGENHLYAIYPYPAIATDTVSGVRTETKMAYRAMITIFDNLGHFVAEKKFEFGYDGELDDPDLENSENATHFGTVTWDQHTAEGRLASSGVYIWKIHFVFADGHKEWRYVRSGVQRK